MAKRADAANALRHVHELRVVALLDELLEPTVHVADTRNRVDDGLVLEDEIEMDGFGQDGMLRPERDDGAFTHRLPPCPSSPAAPRAARGFIGNFWATL